MKQKILNKFWLQVLMLVAVMTAASAGTALGQGSSTWSHEFASPEAISNGSITVDNVTWNVSTVVKTGSPAIDKGNSYSKYCLKFGSGAKNCFQSVTFSTDYFADYNVLSVTVNVLHNASKSGTLSAIQGNTTIGTKTQTVGSSWTDMTVNTTSGSGGTLSFTYSPTDCAVNIHSITVVYTTSGGSSNTPSLSVSPASINFGDQEINDSYEETFDVTFANLTENLSVSVGSVLTGVTVSPTTISKDATSPQTVTVTYAPTAVGNIDGNITVSNTDDGVSETVAVTGSAYDPSNVDTYERYTGAIVEGDYVIYNSNGAMKNSISSNRFENGTVTINGTTITNPDKSVVWHIAPIANTNYWTIYNADAGKYAGGTSSKNQGALLAEVTDLAKWIITYQYSNYTIENYGRSQASTDNNNKYLRQNSTSGWATYASGTGSVPQLYKKVVTNQVAQPTFSVAAGTYYETQNVTISCETQDATIYYTIDGSTPSSSNGTEYSTAISVSTTTTIKAIAVKSGMADSDVATATYTIEQPYSTIPALFAAATATEQDVRVTFNNWVVSGVSTNGQNIYVTDNSGNGFIIYFTSNQSNIFAAGKVLSGTAVACKLKLYNGAAELVNLNANDLTITSDGTVTAASVAMAELSGVNTGALVSYDNLTCTVENNKYYLSDGTTTLQAYNTLYAFDELEAGKLYNITGVYVQYNNTKEIAPRSTDDIEEVSYTITAISNDDTMGTVSLTNKVITASPESGYRVSTTTPYTVSPANSATIVQNGNEFTVTPSANCTVTINFEAIPTHTVTFSVNGTVVNTANVAEDAAITFPSNPAAIAGKTFVGWAETTIDGTTNNAPTLVTSATMGANDVTFYAVFATVSGSGSATAALTANSSWSSYADKEFTDDKGNTWYANCSGQNISGTYYYGLRSYDNGSYLESPTFSGNVTAITVNAKNGSSTANRTFYVKSTKDGTEGDLGEIEVTASADGVDCTASLSNNSFNKFYLTVSGALQFHSIEVTYSSESCSDYCTTIAIPITVSQYKFATAYYSNCALKVPAEGVTAHTFKVGTSGKLERSKDYEAGDVIPAGEAVVLYAPNANGTSYSFQVSTTNEEVDANSVLKGSDETATTTGGTYYYMLSLNSSNDANSIGFYYGAANGGAFTNGAHKAYVAVNNQLVFNGTGVGGARLLSLFDENGGTTTGISNVNVNENDNCYDLQGRRVAQPQKGLYIVNGKKVIIK